MANGAVSVLVRERTEQDTRRTFWAWLLNLKWTTKTTLQWLKHTNIEGNGNEWVTAARSGRGRHYSVVNVRPCATRVTASVRPSFLDGSSGFRCCGTTRGGRGRRGKLALRADLAPVLRSNPFEGSERVFSEWPSRGSSAMARNFSFHSRGNSCLSSVRGTESGNGRNGQQNSERDLQNCGIFKNGEFLEFEIWSAVTRRARDFSKKESTNIQKVF